VSANPTSGLEVPANDGKRERIAPPEEAESLIAALEGVERAIWATALYGGLRLGELRALRLDEVDVAGGVIQVQANWDPVEGRLATKSRAGKRAVPLIPRLADELAIVAEHRQWPTGLIFGRSPDRPFATSTAYSRARRQWREKGCDSILLHECRHSYASYMIAAGVNAKALCSIMGHSSITETFDRYGHLFPGDEAEAGTLLTSYLAR
jgi:integrase